MAMRLFGGLWQWQPDRERQGFWGKDGWRMGRQAGASKHDFNRTLLASLWHGWCDLLQYLRCHAAELRDDRLHGAVYLIRL